MHIIANIDELKAIRKAVTTIEMASIPEGPWLDFIPDANLINEQCEIIMLAGKAIHGNYQKEAGGS